MFDKKREYELRKKTKDTNQQITKRNKKETNSNKWGVMSAKKHQLYNLPKQQLLYYYYYYALICNNIVPHTSHISQQTTHFLITKLC
jgi:hypothetical protein